MKFKAWLRKVSKDKDGEGTIAFGVPLTEAGEIFNIPANKNLKITVEVEEEGGAE